MLDALHRLTQSVYDQTICFAGHHITIRRLDQIHPHISGNKFYKLKYNLLAAKDQGYQHILTFGGAYSNHIAATAFAAQQFGFCSLGVIRGDELQSRPLNPTLKTAQQFGMQLHFVSRKQYRLKEDSVFFQELSEQFPQHYLLPEGGTNALAIHGCAEILQPADQHYDLICCAVGTGGTLSGLIEASKPHQHVLGFSALKGDFLTHDVVRWTNKKNWRITDRYCCGGYAKTTPELFDFIHQFEQQYHIPLEQIYTGKMLLGLKQMIEHKEIPAHYKVLVIHSGGLQGRHPSLDLI